MEKQNTIRLDLFFILIIDLLDEYITKLDNLFNQLNTPAADRLHHIIFGLKSNLKQALQIRHPNTYHEIVIFIRKNNCYSTDTVDELVGVIKELRHHQILRPKEENITTPVTFYYPGNLQKEIVRMEQGLRDLMKYQKPTDKLHNYKFLLLWTKVICTKYLKVGIYQPSWQILVPRKF